MLNQVRQYFSFFMILGALSFPVGAASDESLPLTVNDARNGSSKVLFIDDLESYDQFEILTTTPWTNGVSKFEGILLKDIIGEADLQGKKLVVTAYNDYWAAIPGEDLLRYDVLLAWKRDGHSMELRDMGPFWIVYPLDDLKDIASELLHKMVWQVKKIDVSS